MRTLLITAAIALSYGITTECVAQKTNVRPGSEYKSTVRFGENNAIVPSHFGTHILISVNVNGSQVELALDTGSSYSLMAARNTEELKLKRVKGNYVGCALPEYTKARIKIGKILIENQRLCPNLQRGVDSEVAESKINLPGLLGYDFLRNFVVEVDYPHRVVVLHNPATFKHQLDKDYVGEVPFRLVNGRPHIKVAMVFGNGSRQPFDALIDTGSWYAMRMTGPMLELINKRPPQSWEFGKEWVLNIQSVINFEPSNLAGPVDFDAEMGNPSLMRYKVFFDYPNARLVLSDSVIP